MPNAEHLAVTQGLRVRQAAVLGAGVMGAQIAAHLANAGIETLLFDLPAATGDTNSPVIQALANLEKLDPAPLSAPARLSCISAANYAEDMARLRDCDLVIEAIAERLDWKSELLRKIAPFLGEETILASNTSGLSINALAEALPEALWQRFCGMHFFNPPRYMHLVELVACRQTGAALLDRLETFLVSTLGKGVVRAKDTPSFIANRIGVFSMLATRHHAARYGLGLDTVDALTGRYLGRPKSATFRTLDVVGLDVFAQVVSCMHETLADDPWQAHFVLPDWFAALVREGALGQKTRRGIYQKVGDEIHVLDPQTQVYRLSQPVIDPSVRDILREHDWAAKLSGLHDSAHPQAQFLWAMFRDMSHYCAWHLETIAHSARDPDFAMRWGFGWDQGPFEIWQAAGWQRVAGWIAADIADGKAMSGARLPDWVMAAARTGVHTPEGSWAPGLRTTLSRSALPVYRRQIYPDRLFGEPQHYGETVFETSEMRLWHSGDGIAVLSFKTKMHTIGAALLADMLRALALAEAEFSALILWQTEPPFSYGANLLQLMQGVQTPAAHAGLLATVRQAVSRAKYSIAEGGGIGKALHAASGDGPKVDEVVAQFQQVSQRIKYAEIPVIAAIDGIAFGGGCEIALHCARIVATLESYPGLVEAGVGLLPAGGGCKEMALRAADEATRYTHDQRIDEFPFLQRYFRQIAMGEVAKSAELAREMGYLRAGDRIVMNRFELLHVAKAEARALAATAWRPPVPERQVRVAGRAGIANLQAAMINLLEGGFISQHDYTIGCAIAETLCGGDVDAGTPVSEQWLLDLERKNFMALLATEKSQARIEYMLKHGKALRN